MCLRARTRISAQPRAERHRCGRGMAPSWVAGCEGREIGEGACILRRSALRAMQRTLSSECRARMRENVQCGQTRLEEL